MDARKWVSNSKQVLAAIPEEHRASELLIQDTDQPMSKTFGLSWFSEEDTLPVPAPPHSTTQPITKRSVAPLVTVTVPRLELMAAVNGSRILSIWRWPGHLIRRVS